MTDTNVTAGAAAVASDAIQKILDQLTAKIGASQAQALAPIVQQYGPAFVAMTGAEIWAWIDKAVKGDAAGSYAAVLAKLPNSQLPDEWTKLHAQWQSANDANAAAVAWQRDALGALLKGLVTIAASMVVL